MYLSRLTLQTQQLSVYDITRAFGADGYRTHQTLWDLFGGDPDAARDFLYRRDDQGGVLRFLVLSERQPEDRRGVWAVETKPYRPQVREGQVLAFSLRLNPVVSRRDAQGRQQRHDIVMDYKHRLKNEGTPPGQWPGRAELVRQGAWTWLSQRMHKLGFVLSEAAFFTEAYEQHQLFKKDKSPIHLSTVDCRGHLTVKDTERFQRTLTKGIGPAKAFGCGLLLVKKV